MSRMQASHQLLTSGKQGDVLLPLSAQREVKTSSQPYSSNSVRPPTVPMNPVSVLSPATNDSHFQAAMPSMNQIPNLQLRATHPFTTLAHHPHTMQFSKQHPICEQPAAMFTPTNHNGSMDAQPMNMRQKMQTVQNQLQLRQPQHQHQSLPRQTPYSMSFGEVPRASSMLPVPTSFSSQASSSQNPHTFIQPPPHQMQSHSLVYQQQQQRQQHQQQQQQQQMYSVHQHAQPTLIYPQSNNVPIFHTGSSSSSFAPQQHVLLHQVNANSDQQTWGLSTQRQFNSISTRAMPAKRNRPSSMEGLHDMAVRKAARTTENYITSHKTHYPTTTFNAPAVESKLQQPMQQQYLRDLTTGSVAAISKATDDGAYNTDRQGYHSRTSSSSSQISVSSTSNREEMTGSLQRAKPRHWSPREDDCLRNAVAKIGEQNWKRIAEHVPGRNHVQCLQRWKKALDPSLVKGPWSETEDATLTGLVEEHGFSWKVVAKHINGRNTKQCRERWCNYLDPNLKRGKWSPEEDTTIMRLQQQVGNRWAAIAKELPGRTDNQVKIRYHSLCRKDSAKQSYLSRLASARH